MNLKEAIVLLGYQVNEDIGFTNGFYERKTKREISIKLFVLIITLMLAKTFSEALMSIRNKQNYKTFTKSRSSSKHCLFTLMHLLIFVKVH